MAAPTAAGKNKGPLVDPALCRCCRSIKKCRLLTAEYDWMGNKEIYSDMFMDCFGLLVSKYCTYFRYSSGRILGVITAIFHCPNFM